MAVVSIMASQDPLIMHLLRCMHFFWALHDISVWAEHIPGASNTVADAISCNNLEVIFQEVPGASKVPDPIHPALRQLLVDQQPDWLSDNWRALLKASLPTAWQQARGRPMDPVRQAITSFAENWIWPTYRQARTTSSSSWLSCHTQPPGRTSQQSSTYIPYALLFSCGLMFLLFTDQQPSTNISSANIWTSL